MIDIKILFSINYFKFIVISSTFVSLLALTSTSPIEYSILSFIDSHSSSISLSINFCFSSSDNCLNSTSASSYFFIDFSILKVVIPLQYEVSLSWNKKKKSKKIKISNQINVCIKRMYQVQQSIYNNHHPTHWYKDPQKEFEQFPYKETDEDSKNRKIEFRTDMPKCSHPLLSIFHLGIVLHLQNRTLIL